MERGSRILGIAVAVPLRIVHLEEQERGFGAKRQLPTPRIEDERIVPLSVISISLSSESKTFANGRRRGAVRRLVVVGRGRGVGSPSPSLESEGD